MTQPQRAAAKAMPTATCTHPARRRNTQANGSLAEDGRADAPQQPIFDRRVFLAP